MQKDHGGPTGATVALLLYKEKQPQFPIFYKKNRATVEKVRFKPGHRRATVVLFYADGKIYGYSCAASLWFTGFHAFAGKGPKRWYWFAPHALFMVLRHPRLRLEYTQIFCVRAPKIGARMCGEVPQRNFETLFCKNVLDHFDFWHVFLPFLGAVPPPPPFPPPASLLGIARYRSRDLH